MIKIT